MAKLPTRPLQKLQERHREMARRLVMGERQIDVAKAMGITPPRMSDITRSPTFMGYMRELSDEREMDVKEAVSHGADLGLEYLLRVLDPDTPEGRQASQIQKIRVAQDFLDREGSAPRVRSSQSTNQSVGLHLTGEDIEQIKASARARRRRHPKPAEKTD